MGLFQPDERHRRGAGPARLSNKAVVVHSLAQARATLAAASALNKPVTLMSGAGAAGYAGPGWFLEVVRQARAEFPEVKVTAILDCAEAPGRALAALRLGVKHLRLGGNARARSRVAAIAARMGARVNGGDYALLDLANTTNARAAVLDFLK